MIHLIFDAPLWVSGLALVVMLSCFALLAMVIVRRWALPRFRLGPHDGEYAATLIHSIIVIYGLVAALITISVWEKYSQVSENVANEATAVGSVWRDLGGYPSPWREAMREILRGYTSQTITIAWPLQRKGVVPTAGVEWMNRFQERLFEFEPATEGQRLLHAETLRAYNQMILMRRLRLHAVEVCLPGVLWLMVVGGALVTIVVAQFFRVADAGFQALFNVCLAVVMSMVILVILSLDRPFRGDLGIPASALQLIYEQLMAPH